MQHQLIFKMFEFFGGHWIPLPLPLSLPDFWVSHRRVTILLILHLILDQPWGTWMVCRDDLYCLISIVVFLLCIWSYSPPPSLLFLAVIGAFNKVYLENIWKYYIIQTMHDASLHCLNILCYREVSIVLVIVCVNKCLLVFPQGIPYSFQYPIEYCSLQTMKECLV